MDLIYGPVLRPCGQADRTSGVGKGGKLFEQLMENQQLKDNISLNYIYMR